MVSDQVTVPVNPFRVPFGNWPFSLMNVQVNISQLILRWFKNVEPVNTAPQRCNCVCKMEWKEKHVVFMVGLHGGRTGVLPRILREHYQRNLLVDPRVLAQTGFTARLKTLETRAQQFGYSLHMPHQLMPVDWNSIAVP